MNQTNSIQECIDNGGHFWPSCDDGTKASTCTRCGFNPGWEPGKPLDDAKSTQLPTPTQREILALGWLSAEFAARADAWEGNAPEWFPEPPEWIKLWEKALAETADEVNQSDDTPYGDVIMRSDNSDHIWHTQPLTSWRYCKHCDLYRPCLCDEEKDPSADASTSNPGVVKPRKDRA